MSKWHYQLIKHVYPNGKVHYAVHEYYTATLGGGGHTLSPVALVGEDPDDIQCLIIHVLNDIAEHGIIEVEHEDGSATVEVDMMTFKKPYKLTVSEVKGETKITEDVALVLEGYALGLQDAMRALTGDNAMAKHYDPLVIENPSVAKSYAFDLLDGGRTHNLNDFVDVGHITKVMLGEFVDWVNEGHEAARERERNLEDRI